MYKYIILLSLLGSNLFSQGGSIPVGASNLDAGTGVCITTGDPDQDPLLRTQTGLDECLIAYDRVNNQTYKYIASMPIGDRWWEEDYAFLDGDTLRIGNQAVYINKTYDRGRILYVNATSGNNSTAVIGDPTRPWADPWTAGAAASPGDVVYGYASSWFISSISQSLTYDEVVFHFDSDVTFTKIGSSVRALFQIELCPTCSPSAPIRGTTDDLEFKMTGYPTLINLPIINYYADDNVTNDPVDQEGDPIPKIIADFEVGTGTTTTVSRSFVEVRGDNIDIKLKMKRYETNGFGEFVNLARFNSQAGFVMEDVTLDINLETAFVDANNNSWRGLFQQYIASDRIYENLNVNMCVDNTIILDAYSEEDAGSLISLIHDNTYRNSNLNFDFGLVKEYSENATLLQSEIIDNQGEFIVHRTTPALIELSADLVDTEVTINCDNCQSNGNGIRYTGGARGVSDNGNYYISGNYRSRYLSPVFLDEVFIGGTASESIYFDGDYISDEIAAIVSTSNLSLISSVYFSGRYATLEASSSVVSTNNPVNLINTIFERPGSDVIQPYFNAGSSMTINVGDARVFGPNAPLFDPVDVTINEINQYAPSGGGSDLNSLSVLGDTLILAGLTDTLKTAINIYDSLTVLGGSGIIGQQIDYYVDGIKLVSSDVEEYNSITGGYDFFTSSDDFIATSSQPDFTNGGTILVQYDAPATMTAATFLSTNTLYDNIDGFYFGANNDFIVARASTGQFAFGSGGAPAGKHRIAFIFDATGWTMYRDGNVVTSGVPSLNSPSAIDVIVGNDYDGSRPADATILELVYYETKQSASFAATWTAGTNPIDYTTTEGAVNFTSLTEITAPDGSGGLRVIGPVIDKDNDLGDTDDLLVNQGGGLLAYSDDISIQDLEIRGTTNIDPFVTYTKDGTSQTDEPLATFHDIDGLLVESGDRPRLPEFIDFSNAGTILIHYKDHVQGGFPRLFSTETNFDTDDGIDISLANNGITLFGSPSGSQVSLSTATLGVAGQHRIAITFGPSGTLLYFDGDEEINSATNIATSSLNRVVLGNLLGSDQPFNGKILSLGVSDSESIDSYLEDFTNEDPVDTDILDFWADFSTITSTDTGSVNIAGVVSDKNGNQGQANERLISDTNGFLSFESIGSLVSSISNTNFNFTPTNTTFNFVQVSGTVPFTNTPNIEDGLFEGQVILLSGAYLDNNTVKVTATSDFVTYALGGTQPSGFTDEIFLREGDFLHLVWNLGHWWVFGSNKGQGPVNDNIISTNTTISPYVGEVFKIDGASATGLVTATINPTNLVPHDRFIIKIKDADVNNISIVSSNGANFIYDSFTPTSIVTFGGDFLTIKLILREDGDFEVYD